MQVLYHQIQVISISIFTNFKCQILLIFHLFLVIMQYIIDVERKGD
nr:MAG TPA: hypothetical protein [Caudoviricetes sp.]